MSQENVDVVRRTHDAFRRGDLDAFLECAHPEIEFRPAVEARLEGGEGVYTGREGLRRWWEDMAEAWDEFVLDVSEYRDLGDRVLVLARVRSRARTSGIPFETRVAQLMTVENGQVRESRDFFDVDAALEAAGQPREGRSQPRREPEAPPVSFQKWQALGNDYVILERDRLPFELTAARVRRLCASHFGVHSDGVLLLAPSDDERIVARLRIFNPDGSEAELSGNGAREAILYLRREGWTDRERFTIETPAGEITPTVLDERTCAVEMGTATLASADFPSGGPDGRGRIEAGGRELDFQHVNVGNPQCVIEVGDELEDIDLAALGSAVERSELFPNRTNVAFIRLDSAAVVSARIFERGVGETLSSGTGACASAVAAVLRGATSPVTVRLEGGELEVAVGDDLSLTLTGWAEPVFRGELAPELVTALEAT